MESLAAHSQKHPMLLPSRSTQPTIILVIFEFKNGESSANKSLGTIFQVQASVIMMNWRTADLRGYSESCLLKILGNIHHCEEGGNISSGSISP